VSRVVVTHLVELATQSAPVAHERPHPLGRIRLLLLPGEVLIQVPRLAPLVLPRHESRVTHANLGVQCCRRIPRGDPAATHDQYLRQQCSDQHP
jgi:hypothetical protein